MITSFRIRFYQICLLSQKGEKTIKSSIIMKKLSVLFAVMALAMFAFIFSASAQEAELPAIDKEAAEPYLGTWYIEKMCFGADCVNLSGMGSTSTITFNSDNTLQIASEEKTDTYSWFMEDGTAYMVETIDGNTRNFPITLDENGCLLLGQDEVTVHYVHEIAPVPGTGALKEDAVFEDFAGEWVLNGMLFEKESIPASLIGVSGTLIVKEEALSLAMMDEKAEEEIPYELKDGKLYAVSSETDNDGKTVEKTVVFEYHADNTVLMSVEGEDGYMVFVREANASSGISVFEGISDFISLDTAENAESSANNSQEEKIDLQVIEEKVKELMEKPEVQNFVDGLKDENGELSLESVVNGLSGMFNTTDENGNNSLNLDTLLQDLGGLFAEPGK